MNKCHIRILLILFLAIPCFGNIKFSELLYNGSICYENKKYDSAIELFRGAIAEDSNRLEAYLFLGETLMSKKVYCEAEEVFSNALKLFPQNEYVLIGLSDCYMMQYKFEDMVDSLSEYTKHNSPSAGILGRLGTGFSSTGRPEKAKECYRKALEFNPYDPVLHMNLGCAEFSTNDVNDSDRHLSYALSKLPNSPLANINFSRLKLIKGELKEGYPIYNKYRWEVFNKEKPTFGKPEFRGDEDIRGKTVFVWTEQGTGDVLQFVRYASVLKARGAKVLLFLHMKFLKKLLSNLTYIDEILLRGDRMPNFDYHISAMELPEVLGTTIEKLPFEVSCPYLCADENLVSSWKKELAKDKNLKVGVCFHGIASIPVTIPGVKEEKRSKNDKSVPDEFIPLFKNLDGVTLYSLEPFFNYGKMLDVHEFDETFDKKNGSFMDTAAVIKNMDLVVTVDTGVAHLAGGLGVPVWIMVTFHPDWRWFLNRDDSPWYPTARLFRHPKKGDWKSAIEKVKKELNILVKKKKKLT